MKLPVAVALLIVLTTFGVSCGPTGPGQAPDSPTQAYKRLFAAVKAKNTEEIKRNLTKNSIAFGKFNADLRKAAPDSVFENGMTESTLSETLPATRDERIKDTMGAVEVWNSRAGQWEDLPFVLEDGAWKLAVGEAFSGTYKSPGIGRDLREREAANAARPASPTPGPNANKTSAPNRK